MQKHTSLIKTHTLWQELVFHRDDVCSKMRQYSRKPTEGKCLHDHAVKTLLSQGHLVPLPLHAGALEPLAEDRSPISHGCGM